MAQVTILVPNYKTLKLTQLCLRLLKKFSDTHQIRVLVIDNESNDESTEYLRSLSWISLIERKACTGETGAQAHARALDLAMDNVETPYVLSIHTDTFVKRPDWLPFLLSYIENDPSIAGVGSWKLEEKPFIKKIAKKIEYAIQLAFYTITGRTDHPLEGKGKNHYYLRSHCALYRTDLLRRFNLHFCFGNESAGKHLHQELINQGYKMIFLPSEVLCKYIDHVNHATVVLNPEFGSSQRTVGKGLKRLTKTLKQLNAEEVLQDTSLDQ